ncbi:MAG TPA: cytochrome c oxidase assembly protein [Stellaceae bacterium]|nr:cytochrome c oxidase assembly protein [Stellaceae bacterium]
MISGKRRTLLGLLAVIAVMSGLVAASVPLYRLFCAATGYNGTTQRAQSAPGHEVMGRLITVRFDAETAPGLPWDFQPEQRQVKVHPGEEKLVAFRAINRSAQPVTGHASFNVTPSKAGIYFDKLQCFCFSAQRLEPGASAELTVSFFVDPALVSDPETNDVDTITLSYTMFRSTEDGPRASASDSIRSAAN